MTTSRRRSGPVRQISAAAALAGLLALTAGCGSDDSAGGPDPAPSASATSGSADPAASTDASPSVTPASGTTMTIRTVSVTGPEGWKPLTNEFGKLGKAVRDPSGAGMLGLYSVPSMNPDGTLDELVAAVTQQGSFEGTPKVLDPVTVDGVECYHITGRYPDGQEVEQFGAVHADDQVNVTFQFEPDVPAADRQQTIDSVLATVVWG